MACSFTTILVTLFVTTTALTTDFSTASLLSLDPLTGTAIHSRPCFPAPRPAARFPAYGIIDLAHMHFTIYYQLCPCHMPESQLPMTCRQSQPQSHAPPPRLRLHTPPREHTPSCKMTKKTLAEAALPR